MFFYSTTIKLTVMYIEPVVKRAEHEGEIYFDIYWSPIRKADKYSIVTSVPSVGGIYELYYMDREKKLNLLDVDLVWYGGLRSRLRKETDPSLVTDKERSSILENYDIYYRYTMTNSSKDMRDIIFFFSSIRFPSKTFEHSGRYDAVNLKEHSPQKIVTV